MVKRRTNKSTLFGGGLKGLVALAAIGILSGGLQTPVWAADNKIIQDSEYQLLLEQYGDKWAAEDLDIEKKLDALKKKHGKRPNIIHIMWDDMKYGAIGHKMLNNVTGYRSPNINKLAANGMTFTRMYTEPSCTPTRVAAMTGRQPVRSGMIFPIFPIHRMGLPGSEVTIAEVLDDDYTTGFFEKSHFGDMEESYLHNQGFDEAIFTLYNQFAGQMFTPEAEDAFLTLGWEKDEWDRYALDKKFRPTEWMWAVEGFKGQKGKEVSTPRTAAEYLEFNVMAYSRVKQFIEKHANDDKPFLLDWWPNALEMFSPKNSPKQTPHGSASSESFFRLDKQIGEIVGMLEKLGIADNTLIVLMADNGPMAEIWPDTYHNPGIFRGGKNDFLEGGVRVPAFAYWPGVIEKGAVVHDMVHATDLFTTFARLGGKMDAIPRDRVIDGIDQTSLLLNGDGNGRRDHVFIYQGPQLSAIVKQQYKRHFAGAAPGLAGKGFFDLEKDPREEHPLMAQFLWAWPAFDFMKSRHEDQIKKYPHTPVATGEPYTGVTRLVR
ncbi:MAG: sulfatase-like hydrolase/transferase [Rhizobiaceae bacterium]|nr:sulfatase-like hydrolase/transferase [Rhizobiaceae bacterium]